MIEVFKLGCFDPPNVTCAECRSQQITQGSGSDVHRLKIDGVLVDLCEPHLVKLAVQLKATIGTIA